MKKYLTIGEVSKIKQVSPKSLRYYEKLGILLPAYTNKETGYRYYTVEQLLIVELIHICIELGIPLKNFKNYITPQEDIDIEKLVAEGSQIVNEKIRKLESQKQFLSNVFVHVQRTNIVKERQERLSRTFRTVIFLRSTMTMIWRITKPSIWNIRSCLHSLCGWGSPISSIRAFFLSARRP